MDDFEFWRDLPEEEPRCGDSLELGPFDSETHVYCRREQGHSGHHHCLDRGLHHRVWPQQEPAFVTGRMVQR